MRKFKLANIQGVAKGLQPLLADARAYLSAYQDDLRKLDEPENKKRFSGFGLAEEKKKVREKGQEKLREFLEKGRANAAAVLKDKPQWSRAALLNDVRFVNRPDSQRDLLAHEKAMLESLADLRDVMARQLEWSKIQRMSDAGLEDYAKTASESGDLAGLSLAWQEAGLREKGMLTAKMRRFVDSADIPEQKESESLFSEIESALDELETLHDSLSSTDTITQGKRAFFDWRRKQQKPEAAAAITNTQPDLPPAA